MQFMSPFPRTSETMSLGSFANSDLNNCPIRSAFSANFSSSNTFKKSQMQNNTVKFYAIHRARVHEFYLQLGLIMSYKNLTSYSFCL